MDLPASKAEAVGSKSPRAIIPVTLEGPGSCQRPVKGGFAWGQALLRTVPCPGARGVPYLQP